MHHAYCPSCGAIRPIVSEKAATKGGSVSDADWRDAVVREQVRLAALYRDKWYK